MLEHIYNGLIVTIYVGGVICWCLYFKKAEL